MKKEFKSRGETALDELLRTYESVRELLVKRLNDVDVEDLRKRGYKYAAALREGMEQRVRPKPKRRRLPLAGVLVVGAAAAAVGYLLYDKGRRDALRGRVGALQEGARQRYAELGGVGGAVGKVRSRGEAAVDEAQLEGRVREAIAAGGEPPAGLKVTVEGRTVYLRGAVDQTAFVDAAAERVHAVEGVVAVVNLTTTPAPARSGAAAPNGEA